MKQATNAKEQTDQATIEEQETLALIESAIMDCTITYTDSNGDTAPIPAGFIVSKVEGEQTIDEGLVIKDSNGNEFVWIPVEDASTMYGTDSSGNNLGKLYTDFSGTASSASYSALNWTETEGVMSWTIATSYREPHYLTDTTSGDASTETGRGLNLLSSIVGISGTVGEDDEEMISTWAEQLQDEFDEMITSVEENGGFYVGRYETSLSDEGKAQSKKGENSVTSNSVNTWYGLYQIEKKFAENNSYIGSSMIWGSQYDQMMIWMQKSGIDVSSTEPIDGVSRNTTRITGSVETDKLNNIYDILGSCYEWTLEAFSTANRARRRRRL